MLFGKYGKPGEFLPRVFTISVTRYRAELPSEGEPLEFLVGIHEEGTGVAWYQNVVLDPEAEASLLRDTADLYRWSLGRGLDATEAADRIERVGNHLFEAFIGTGGEEYLGNAKPTALLLAVDETILNLPWELMRSDGEILAHRTPLGRIVATRIVPKPGRDPLRQDRVVRILAIGDPTSDLSAALVELDRLQGLAGSRGSVTIAVDVLGQRDATIAGFTQAIQDGDYDILHFAGHAHFEQSAPETSALRFADGMLEADQVLQLPWRQPPGLVFNSACESGRAAGGQRLADGSSYSNGLAAAFLAAGASVYAGYFWPVTDVGAALFAEVFYRSLFECQNVGLAFLDARRTCIGELGTRGDLTGYSAVLFGDAASSHRQDVAMAR